MSFFLDRELAYRGSPDLDGISFSDRLGCRRLDVTKSLFPQRGIDRHAGLIKSSKAGQSVRATGRCRSDRPDT